MTERERGQVNSVAIISITKHGVALGGQLHSGMAGNAELFVPAKFAGEAPSAATFTESVREFIGKCFYKYDGLVIFISLGAVVRMIAEHLQDKHVDPAVKSEAQRHRSKLYDESFTHSYRRGREPIAKSLERLRARNSPE